MIILTILFAFSALAGVLSYYGFPVRSAVGTAETRASRAAYDAFSFFLGLGILFGVEAIFPKLKHTPLLASALVLTGYGITRLVRPPFNDAAVRFLRRYE